jgi:hypothetical protein
VAVALGDTVEAQKVITFVIPLHLFFFRKRLFFSLLSLLEFNRTIAELANGKKEDTNLIQSLCFRSQEHIFNLIDNSLRQPRDNIPKDGRSGFVYLFDSKKVKDLLPKKMGRFRPTRKLSKIFVN